MDEEHRPAAHAGAQLDIEVIVAETGEVRLLQPDALTIGNGGGQFGVGATAK